MGLVSLLPRESQVPRSLFYCMDLRRILTLKGSFGCVGEECTRLAITTNVWSQKKFVAILTLSKCNVDFCLVRVLPFLSNFIIVGVMVL